MRAWELGICDWLTCISGGNGRCLSYIPPCAFVCLCVIVVVIVIMLRVLLVVAISIFLCL